MCPKKLKAKKNENLDMSNSWREDRAYPRHQEVDPRRDSGTIRNPQSKTAWSRSWTLPLASCKVPELQSADYHPDKCTRHTFVGTSGILCTKFVKSKIRVSNRSAGLISSRFPGVSGRHFDENSVEFEVFETVNFNLNEEACGDRLQPTPITVSSNNH